MRGSKYLNLVFLCGLRDKFPHVFHHAIVQPSINFIDKQNPPFHPRQSQC